MRRPIQSFLLFAGLLTYNSCGEKFLDLAPMSTLTEANFYKTEADATVAVNAVYDALQKGGSGKQGFWQLGYGTTGDLFTPGLGGVTQLGRDLNYDPNNPIFLNTWNIAYLGITRANATIDNVSRMDIGETARNQVLGQARFLRALFYFHLVRCFGDVPLPLRQPLASDDFSLPRAPRAEVLDQVKADLAEAVAALPVTWENPGVNLGRATRGSALALLAKVHLEGGEWNRVIARTEELDGLGKYRLNDVYTDNWNQARENGPESVFEIQFRDGVGGWSDDNDGHFNNQAFAPAGAGRDFAVEGGWGQCFPRARLDEIFEAGDGRRSGQLLRVGEKHRNSAFVLPASGPGSSPTGLVFQKYWDGPYASGITGSQYSPLNFPYLRYAEVLLNYAEALNETGNGPAAVAGLNKVRRRAGLPDYAGATDPAAVLDAIFRERRVEFPVEFNFFFDLRRRGRFKQFRQENFGDGDKVLPKHALFPIPQAERDKNPNLTQNDGY